LNGQSVCAENPGSSFEQLPLSGRKATYPAVQIPRASSVEKFHPNTAGRRSSAPQLHALYYDPQGLIDKRRSK
jgi:hypothetical protein